MPMFLRIYERRNLTAAAREMDMSQPSLSRALKKLRTLTADPLFERGADGLVPTDRAHQLYRQVSASLQALERSLTTPHEQRQLPSPLVLAADPWVQDAILPTLAAVLGDGLYQLQIRLQWNQGNQPQPDDAEPHMVLGPAQGQKPGLELYREDWVCALRPGHPAAGSQLSLSDYLLLTHLLAGPASREVMRAIGRVSRRQLALVHTADLAAAARLLPETDLALTCPRSFAVTRGWYCAGLPFAMPVRDIRLHLNRADAADDEPGALELLGQQLVGHFSVGALARQLALGPPGQ